MPACIQVQYKEPTPPNQDLVLRSTIVKVKDNAEKVGSGKPSVQVDLSLHQVGTAGTLSTVQTCECMWCLICQEPSEKYVQLPDLAPCT